MSDQVKDVTNTAEVADTPIESGSEGKGKGKATEEMAMDDDDSDETSDEVSHTHTKKLPTSPARCTSFSTLRTNPWRAFQVEGDADPEDADEDNMEEIDTENIMGSRTRGKNIDYAEAAKNMEAEDDEDEEDDEDFKDDDDDDKMRD